MDTQLVAKLLEADPEFEQFVETLYGVSKMHDSSEVHVNGDDPKRDKRLAYTGLAATGVAGVGAGHAIKTTIAEHRGVPKKPGRIIPKLARKMDPKKAALIGTAGWLGLHAVEGVGDVLNARAQVREIRRSKQEGVSKARVPHFEPISVVHSNARFRALGMRNPNATYRRPAVVSKVGGTFVRTVGEEFIAGARPREAYRIPAGRHRPGYREPRDSIGQQPGRHRAEMPRRELTPAGKFTIVGIGGAGAGGAGYEASRRRRQPPNLQPNPVAKADCEWQVPISKLDEDKRLVFGWASLSKVDGQPVTDRQGDYIPIEESEEAAYTYMLNSRKGGDMHRRVTKADEPYHAFTVVESMVFTPEKIEALGLEPDALPHGWWLGGKVHDDQQWQDVKEGKRTGFSVHGTGVRKEMELV